MRHPSRLVIGLGVAYLIPAALLDVAVVRTLGESYSYFDTIAMMLVSAPAGVVTVGVGERFLPLKPNMAGVWYVLLIASQAGNAIAMWLAVRAVQRVYRIVGRVVWGGEPPAAGEAGRMSSVRP